MGKADYVRATIAELRRTTLNPVLVKLGGDGERKYLDWVTNFSMPESFRDFDQDPDKDGKTNAMEQFLGTSPNVADRPEDLNLVLVPTQGNSRRFKATHFEGEDLTSDVSAVYQWSSDLAGYHNEGAVHDSTSVSFTKQLDTPVKGMTTVILDINGKVPANLFLRMRIFQNSP